MGAAFASVFLLSFTLGEIRNEASGRGAEFDLISLGQERANEMVYWDGIGLGRFGWDTARMMNRAIGEHSGLGNSFARGWILALACGYVIVGAGALGYWFTVWISLSLSKLLKSKMLAEQPATVL